MRLVPPDYLSEDDRHIKQLLVEYPLLKWHLTLLLNRYRERCLTYLKELATENMDTLDGWLVVDKIDSDVLRLGIPLAETSTDWMELRDMLRVAQTYGNK